MLQSAHSKGIVAGWGLGYRAGGCWVDWCFWDFILIKSGAPPTNAWQTEQQRTRRKVQCTEPRQLPQFTGALFAEKLYRATVTSHAAFVLHRVCWRVWNIRPMWLRKFTGPKSGSTGSHSATMQLPDGFAGVELAVDKIDSALKTQQKTETCGSLASVLGSENTLIEVQQPILQVLRLIQLFIRLWIGNANGILLIIRVYYYRSCMELLRTCRANLYS